ncbi:MAG: hypothetical protein KatS3mg061_3014 [Dehalococcoidia bacterium]|nr:MAG: hypothetical protein KatS3mg061_3014 [Dehalococcoidia bacterium]
MSVALSRNGDTLLAGAPGADTTTVNCGALYLFTRPPTGWTTTSTFTAKLTAAAPTLNGELGTAVALSADGRTAAGGTAIIPFFSGEALIYVRPSSGWTTTSLENARLTSQDVFDGDGFGTSLALSEDGGLLLVGAPAAANGSGAAFIFTRPPTGWQSTSFYTQRLTASDGRLGDFYGSALAFGPDAATIAIGAPNRSDASGNEVGAVYVHVQPRIRLLRPTAGSPGTVITLTGVNLEGATAVTFGGIAALGYTVTSSTEVLATVGFGSSGQVALESRGLVASAGPFTFVPGPTTTTISGLFPSPAQVGRSVTVSFTVSSALGPPHRQGQGDCRWHQLRSPQSAKAAARSSLPPVARRAWWRSSKGAALSPEAARRPSPLRVDIPTTTTVTEVFPNPSFLSEAVLGRVRCRCRSWHAHRICERERRPFCLPSAGADRPLLPALDRCRYTDDRGDL